MGIRVLLVFPGQGAQQPGMGKEMHDAFPSARAVFEEGSDTLGLALTRICFEGSAEELRETRNAQLALFVHGAAAWSVLRERGLEADIAGAAGHSVGEYAAFHAAAALTLGAALRLVEVRGRSMSTSGKAHPGAMAAVLGSTTTPIEDICRASSSAGSEVVPANFNAPEQVVVSGHVEAVERAMQAALNAGARKVVRLNVSGAFHSPLMRGAIGELASALRVTQFNDPAMPVYANVSAAPCTTGTEARSLLQQQLTSPVRWVELSRRMEADNPGALCLELGPGSVLAGLLKRCAPGLRTLPCATPRDLDAVERALSC